MGTILSNMFLIFLLIEASKCCVPIPAKPGAPNNTSSTVETAKTTTIPFPTQQSVSQNETQEEKASTTFSVMHSNMTYACTYEFTYNLNNNVNILATTFSKCEKSNNNEETVNFLDHHIFKVHNKKDIEMSCSLAAVFVKNEDTIELVDNVIHYSIKCSIRPGICLTQAGPSFFSKCSVPFIFNGREYQACTDWENEDGRGKEEQLWCATQTNDEKVMEEGHWGWCSRSCGYCGGKDVVSSASSTTINSSSTTTAKTIPEFSCKTETGKSCIFPFIDGDQTHTECADWLSKYNWCATSVNDDLTYEKWEKCDLSTCGTEGSDVCRTIAGESCVFPFNDGDNSHAACTFWNGRHWCATSLNSDGSSKGWGYCDEDICPLEDTNGRKQRNKNLRSVAKCGYDCLINTNKRMVHGKNEKLGAPKTIFEMANLSNSSYNFVSETMLKFIIGQNGIQLECMMGSFANFDGEDQVSVACTGEGKFRVTGLAFGDVWENVDNTQFGCHPCPGYKSVEGSMKKDTNNTILTHDKVETMIGCIYLCEESEEGCGVFQYSSDTQTCILFPELDLASDQDAEDHFICQAYPCQFGCEDNQRGAGKKHNTEKYMEVKKIVTSGKKVNSYQQCIDNVYGIPLYAKLELSYVSSKPTHARFQGSFVDGNGVFKNLKRRGKKKMGPIVRHGSYDGKKADRGHLVQSKGLHVFFKDLDDDELSPFTRNIFNVLPQLPSVNRGNPWRKTERDILKFAETYAKLGYKVTVEYAVIPGGTTMIDPDTGDDTGINWPAEIYVTSKAIKGNIVVPGREFIIDNPQSVGTKAKLSDMNDFKSDVLMKWTQKGVQVGALFLGCLY